MQKKILGLINNPFLRHNFVFVGSTALVGVLNYVYYPVLGRLLDLEAYGEIQALVSLFLQFSIFLVVLSQICINIIANHPKEENKIQVVDELEKLAFYFSLAMLIIVAAFSWQIKDFFNFTSPLPFIILMLAVAASVPLTFKTAYLRGHNKFGLTSVANVLAAICKIFLSAGLVIIGWSTSGAMVGIVLAQFIAFLYAYQAAKKIGYTSKAWHKFSKLDWKLIKPELKYGLLVLNGSIAVTLLSSIDIFVVKHFFDAQTAGAYAGVSTVARSIYFLTVPIVQVMLSLVKINQSPKENKAIFLRSLTLITILGGATAAIFTIFSTQIINGLMGHEFSTFSTLLPELSLIMLVISELNLIISYNIALRRYNIHGKVILGISFTIFLLSIFHQDLSALLNSLLGGSIFTLLIFCISIKKPK